MPCQSPLVLRVENLSCTGNPQSPHPGQEAQESDPSSLPSNHISLCRSDGGKPDQTVAQPGPLQESQTSSETHCQRLGLQPIPEALAPTVSAALEGEGNRGKGVGAAQGKKHHCGVCGHLLLAVVLTVFSPLIAVGVCVADIVTGECCSTCGKDMDSVDDP